MLNRGGSSVEKIATQTALKGRNLTTFGDGKARQQNKHLIFDVKLWGHRCSEREASTPYIIYMT